MFRKGVCTPRAAETPDVTLSHNSEKVHIPHISINASQRCCRLPVTANSDHIITRKLSDEEKKTSKMYVQTHSWHWTANNWTRVSNCHNSALGDDSNLFTFGFVYQKWIVSRLLGRRFQLLCTKTFWYFEETYWMRKKTFSLTKSCSVAYFVNQLC